MTYEEFLDIPVSVYDDLETILLLKAKYHMEITSEEKEICKHILKFVDEHKTTELYKQRQQLEKLFEK